MMAIPEVDEVLALARRPRLESPFDHPTYRALFSRARAASPDVLVALAGELATGVGAADHDHAACVALSLGTLSEMGAPTSIAGRAIVERLHRVARVASDEPRAMRFLVLAAMAHLARDVDLRIEARRITGLAEAIARAEDVVHDAWFVSETLRLADRVELVVIAPAAGRGYVVRADGVRSNYHLFSLLQGALIGDASRGWLAAEPVDPELLAIARGECVPLREQMDHARFHFHDRFALAADGSFVGSIASSLWSGDVVSGAMSVPRAPIGGGREAHVVVLGPPLLGSLTWGSNFFAGFHDALRSRVEVLEQLTGARLAEVVRAIAG